MELTPAATLGSRTATTEAAGGAAAYTGACPLHPGYFVYRLWSGDVCIYVGMVGERGPRYVTDRLREHQQAKTWWADVDRIDVAECIGLIEVRAEEQRQITALHPKHNQRGKPVAPPHLSAVRSLKFVRHWRNRRDEYVGEFLDGGKVVLCGIAKRGWWCACSPGTRLYMPEVAHLCPHLRYLVATPGAIEAMRCHGCHKAVPIKYAVDGYHASCPPPETKEQHRDRTA